MKSILLSLFCLLTVFVHAQSDTTGATKAIKPAMTHGDSLYLAKMNTSGNLMLVGGIGLTAVGGYLIYQGNKVYTTKVVNNVAEEIDRNHKQGTIYMAVGGVAIAGGLVLTAFGIKNKVEFKKQKRLMSLQTGLLDNGNLGAMLTF